MAVQARFHINIYYRCYNPARTIASSALSLEQADACQSSGAFNASATKARTHCHARN